VCFTHQSEYGEIVIEHIYCFCLILHCSDIETVETENKFHTEYSGEDEIKCRIDDNFVMFVFRFSFDLGHCEIDIQ